MGCVMRWGLAGLVTVAMLSVSTTAHSQAPGFSVQSEVDSTSQATPGGQQQQVGGGRTVGTKPGSTRGRSRTPRKSRKATRPRRSQRCTTRGGRRTCRVYLDGRHVRTCVRPRRGAKSSCRRVRASASAASFEPSAQSRAAAERSAASAALELPEVQAHISRVHSHGYQDNVVPAVGRFYYLASRGANPLKAWCSGTLIMRGVVLTAAHCLYNNSWDERVGGTRPTEPYGYYDIRQMSFVPGNTVNQLGQTVSSYGTWAVADAFVPEAWKNDDDAYDWGLVLLSPQGNRFPGDYTGTFAANGNVALSYNAPLVKMGYPASGAFATANYWYGSRQYYCSVSWQQRRGTSSSFSPNGWYMMIEGCPMNGGSSGGPVFARYSNGTYGIIGVNNRGRDVGQFGSVGYNIWFDQRAIDFFNGVIAYWRG